MKKCTKCGKIEENNNLKRCSECGGDLVMHLSYYDENSSVDTVESDGEADVLSCPACRSAVRPGAAFCAKCGTPMRGHVPPAREYPYPYAPTYHSTHGAVSSSGGNKVGALLLVVVLVLILAAGTTVAALYYMNTRSSQIAQQVEKNNQTQQSSSTQTNQNNSNEKESFSFDDNGNLIDKNGNIVMSGDELKQGQQDSDENVPSLTESQVDVSPQETHKIVPSNCTWSTAQYNAKYVHGGSLASINSASEFREICNKAERAGLRAVWVGASRYSGQNWYSVYWEDGTPLSSYMNWRDKEPSERDYSQASEPEERYLMLLRDSSTGQWGMNDTENDISKFHNGKMGYAVEFE